ncbi:response regulator [Mariprofundus ferrooxydans]|nr:response regulator [Mariprofundus ferrooxydans]
MYTATLTTGEQMILLVDDDLDILETCQQVLEESGFHVISCTSGVEAIKMFHTLQQEINTVITDYNMPIMTGLELIQNMRMHQPSIKTILISGNFSEKLPHNITLIEKPFSFDTLLSEVRKSRLLIA